MSQSQRQRDDQADRDSAGPAVVFHLLGTIDYDACDRLQRRLIDGANLRDDGRIEVLLCEHSPIITVGRRGSRRHIRIGSDELRRRQWEVRWVARGGGGVLHAPGQLAIHAVVPLRWHGWTLAGYQRRLSDGLAAALGQLNAVVEPDAAHGLSGRTGQIVHLGVGVRDGVAHHGAFLNVNPTFSDFQAIETMPPIRTSTGPRGAMSSLLAEHRQPVRMASVRAAVTEHLAAAFGCDHYHIYTGHPLLPKPRAASSSLARYAGRGPG